MSSEFIHIFQRNYLVIFYCNYLMLYCSYGIFTSVQVSPISLLAMLCHIWVVHLLFKSTPE